MVRLSMFWPYGLIALLAIVFHARMLFTGVNDMIATADIGYYFQWMHQFVRDQLLSGRIPLWNPYNYCGMPFAANPQATVFYPPSWLHLIMPVLHAHKYMIALHGFLAGSFMHLYLRRVGASPIASVLGGAVYMLGNYFMANAVVGHLTMIFTMTWIPLALYALERAILQRSWTWAFWTGCVLGVQVLAGEPQNSYYTSMLLAAYALIHTLSSRTGVGSLFKSVGFALAALALAAVVAACTGAVQLIPTAELAGQSDRSDNSFEFATFVSCRPQSLLEFVMPWANVPDPSGPAMPGLHLQWPRTTIQQNWEFAGYVGIITLALAAMSFGAHRKPALLVAKILLPVAVILMLGRFSPAYKILYHIVPGLSLFRIPARSVVIAHWALSVMAAFGFDHLFNHAANRWRSWRWRAIPCAVIATLLALLVLAVTWLGLHRVVLDSAGERVAGPALTMADPIVLRPLACMILAAVALLAMGRLGRTVAMVMVLAMAGADLFMNRPRLGLTTYRASNDPNLALMAELREQQNSGASPARADFPHSIATANAAMVGRQEYVNGYAPLSIGRFYRFVHAMRGVAISEQTRHQIPESVYRSNDPFPLRVLNVRFGAKWNPTDRTYVRMTDAGALPRAWLVDRVEVVADEDAAINRLKDRSFNPAITVVLEQPPRGILTAADGSPGTCEFKRLSDHELRIDVTAARDAYLVLSEIFYPGWRALVDDQPVAIERADSVITAIPVPAGRHTVVYRYQPSTFRVGMMITAIVGCVALAVVVRQWRISRGRHAWNRTRA